MKDTIQIRDRRGGNRYFIDNALLRGGWGKKEKLGPYGIAIYNALALHADADDQTAYPSYATLADLTGMSERQAIRKVAELESFNIIHKVSNIQNGKQSSNIYELLHPDEWRKVAYDTQSPVAMTHSHPSYDTQSPKQDPYIKTQLNNITPNGVSPTQKSTAKEQKPKTAVKDKFLELANTPMPKAKKTCSYWWSQFAEILHVAKDDLPQAIQAMETVIPYMQKEGLSITGPQSIVGLCRSVLAGQKLNGKSNETSKRHPAQSFEQSRNAAHKRLERSRNAV